MQIFPDKLISKLNKILDPPLVSIVPKVLETSGLSVFFRSWWPGDRDNVPLHLPVADDVRVAVVDALPFPDLVEGAALGHVTDLDVISRSRGCLS